VRLLARAALVAVALSTGGALAPWTAWAEPITVDAIPIPHFSRVNQQATRFGALEFRGGLVLSSSNRAFGGLSGLHVQPDGAGFVAISDRARWLTGRIEYDGTRPVAIRDAEITPILGPGKKRLSAGPSYDTEGLAVTPNAALIGVERTHQIFRFPYKGDPIAALPTSIGMPIKLPDSLKDLSSNQSLEAIVAPQVGPLKGAVVAIAERALDANGNNRAWIVSGVSTGEFSVVRGAGEFDVTDAAALPDGDVLILERYYAFLGGLKARIRRLPAASIAPGALVDGPILFEASLADDIDNMEAMAVHVAADGATVLTLVSDDNFSRMQRTVLLQFALVPEEKAAP
jgi:hypothetical protein